MLIVAERHSKKNNDGLRVCVLGAGSWGTTIASLVARNTDTILWARNAAIAEEICRLHTNERYLPGTRLSQQLRASDDLELAVGDADVLIMGVPSHGFRAVLRRAAPYVRAWTPIVSLSKGLEEGTNLRMSEIVENVLCGHPVGVLTGPNLAQEVISGHPAASVLAMADETILRRLRKIFRSVTFRVYTNTDLIGCELGGALKNVIAVACGIADGMQAGDNIRAALITRGLAEIARLGAALGGHPASFSGLAGMGDLIATCTSVKSRNYGVGRAIAQGGSLDKIIASMHMVAEGVRTTKSMLALGRDHKIELPIAAQVYSVLYEQIPLREAFRQYLRQDPGAEAEPG